MCRSLPSDNVHLTRVPYLYQLLSLSALCVWNLHTKPTTRRRTPVCHNSSQATALHPGRAVTSFPNIMLFALQAISISNPSSLTPGDPGAKQATRGKTRPCITRRVWNTMFSVRYIHTSHP